MALPSRKYHSLGVVVTEILDCNVDDIIHWGAVGITKIGIPTDHSGFAFISKADLCNAELGDGTCFFESLELADGGSVDHYPTFLLFRDLFMRIEEIEELQDKDNEPNNDTQELFVKADSKYPPELDLAFKAWQAVSSTDGKGKPKARIRAWLDSNTKISNEAKERISIVANWDKSGGATSTD